MPVTKLAKKMLLLERKHTLRQIWVAVKLAMYQYCIEPCPADFKITDSGNDETPKRDGFDVSLVSGKTELHSVDGRDPKQLAPPPALE